MIELIFKLQQRIYTLIDTSGISYLHENHVCCKRIDIGVTLLTCEKVFLLHYSGITSYKSMININGK